MPTRLQRALKLYQTIPIDGANFRPDVLPYEAVDFRLISIDP